MIDQAYALEILRSLAHPVRLQILWMLRRGEEYVCHLVTALGKRQPYVSQQLAHLRRTGLVAQEREGRYVSYKLCDRQFIDHLQELCMHVAPSCPRCLVLPAPWWLCPCPKCAEARHEAGLGTEPLGEYGISSRGRMRDCDHWACVRAWQESADRVAISLSCDCARIGRWAAQLRLVHVSQVRHTGQTQLGVTKAANGYLCRASCLVPTVALQAASVAAGLGQPGVSQLECTADPV